MASRINGVFEKSLNDKIKESKILVVGAGGIGCELLKNLVMTGFGELHVIDLDTIELSNLNRQFLFHKQHIGRPKAIVAKESVLTFNPNSKIIAEHESIFNTKYDVDFFRTFTAVTNALDNVAARAHVNRMCLAADIPLIESGSAGYLGQVTVYKKKLTECFECLPRKQEKSYAGCTIRNTPSQPVHCIVWAKHLFNQLFGEPDADEEVSPDFTDPELGNTANDAGNVDRISTREWAKSCSYDPQRLFNKLFVEDITYLKSMRDLWNQREQPRELLDEFIYDNAALPKYKKGQKLWSLLECREKFDGSLKALKEKFEASEDKILSWDKDDDQAMDFVAACSNLRSWCFSIPFESRFEIKAIAGNIVPAIATTNAVVSGLIVMQLLNVLKGDLSKCRSAWLNVSSAVIGKLISSAELSKPNPNCHVCCSHIPEVTVRANLQTLTVRTLDEKIVKEKLHLVQPDLYVADGSGKVLLSSDPDEVPPELLDRALADFDIKSETRIMCEDFFQHYKIVLIVKNEMIADQEFLMDDDDVDALVSEQEKKAKEANGNKEDSMEEGKKDDDIDVYVADISDDVDDLEVVTKKRIAVSEEGDDIVPPAKKVRTSVEQ